MPGFRLIAAIPALAILAAAPTPLRAQTPPAAAAPKPVDPAFAAAEKTYLALDLETRKQLQLDLIWEGRFNGSASGDFGPLTFAALKRFEEKHKLRPGEGLSEAGRRKLAAEAGKARSAAGFSVTNDKVSGMQIGIPGALLVKSAPNAARGTRWQDKAEKITLDLSILKPEDTLPALFEKGTDAKVAGRKITYKLLRPDFFVISGETAGGKFYRRVAIGPEGGPPRSLSIGYDKAVAAEVDPLIVAIAANFDPFPKTGAARSEPAKSVPAGKPGPAVAEAPKSRRMTGLISPPDSIVTGESAVQGCADIVLAGRRLGEGRPPRGIGNGLTAVHAPREARLDPLRIGKPEDGPAILVQRDSEGVLAAGAATIRGRKVEVSLQEGGAGAALFNRQGALVGLVPGQPVAKFQVAGIVPVQSYAFVPATEALKVEESATAPAAAPRSAADIAEAVRAHVVALVCPVK